MRLFALYAALTLCPLFTGSVSALAAPVLHATATWVGANGKIVDKISSDAEPFRFEWTKSGELPGSGTPVLRIELPVKIAPGLKLGKSSGLWTKVVSLEPAVAPGKGARLIVETSLTEATTEVELIGPKGSETRSLIIRIKADETRLETFGDCAAQLAIGGKQVGHPLFLGYACTERDGALELHFVGSDDMTWEEGKALRIDRKIPLADVPIDGKPAFVLHARDREGHRAEFSVRWVSPLDRGRGLRLSGGLSTTRATYFESLAGVDESQWGLTGKLNAAFPLVPERWTLEANAFATLAVLQASPDTLPGARYLGFNGRLGYRLPKPIAATTITLLGGWYVWTMTVAGDAYGINFLTGPQLFVQARREVLPGIPGQAYVKFAFVTGTSQLIQVGNNEIALGLSLALSRRELPWTASLDVSRIQFSKGLNSMSSTTFSLGLGKAFF